MAEPFISEIKIFTFSFAPKGWAFCNGQLLPINQNQALFSLIGTTYGGDGRTNFALPDLRGLVPMHTGQGFTIGERGGQSAHTVTIAELPAHIHQLNGSTSPTDSLNAKSNLLATPTGPMYAPADSNGVTLPAAAIVAAGGSQPHDNMSPYLVLSFCIALQGIFPTQN